MVNVKNFICNQEFAEFLFAKGWIELKTSKNGKRFFKPSKRSRYKLTFDHATLVFSESTEILKDFLEISEQEINSLFRYIDDKAARKLKYYLSTSQSVGF